MKKMFLRRMRPALSIGGQSFCGGTARLLLLAFVLGVVFGSLVGICSGTIGYESGGESGYMSRAWLFFLLLLIFSTSYLGVVLIPALMFFRGYLFSCSVAVLWSALGLDGLWLSALSSALPLCFLLPCYLVVGGDCFHLALRLGRIRLGRACYVGELFPARHLLALLFMILCDWGYSALLLPRLTSLI